MLPCIMVCDVFADDTRGERGRLAATLVVDESAAVAGLCIIIFAPDGGGPFISTAPGGSKWVCALDVAGIMIAFLLIILGEGGTACLMV